MLGLWSGVVERQDTGSGVSQKVRPQQAETAIRFYRTAADNFHHTQNPHSRTWIREWCRPQGTHTISTIKLALWTTKWLTIVFPWTAQIQFTLQSTITKLIKSRKTSNKS